MSIKEYIEILEELKNNDSITSVQFSVIKSRYINQIKFYEKQLNCYSKFYNIFRFNVTFGSLIVPALLSIQNSDDETLKEITYWTTWAVSLTVTTCNGLIGLFSLDKNYIMYGTTLEKMSSEGWQFLQLSGNYDDYASHKDAYQLFCKNVEYIKIKQIQQQYSTSKSKNKKNDKKDEDQNNNSNNILSSLMNNFGLNMGQMTNQAQNMGQMTNQVQNMGQMTNQAQNMGQMTNQAQNMGQMTNQAQNMGQMTNIVNNTDELIDNYTIEIASDITTTSINNAIDNISNKLDETNP